MIDFNADEATEANTGQFIVALDVGRFTDPPVFAAPVRSERGIPIVGARLDNLNALGTRLGVGPLS